MAESICSIDGCESPHTARGWCSRHWQRWRKYGDPLGAASPQWTLPRFDPAVRFWPRVNVAGPDECWEWTGSRMTNGYGQFRVRRSGDKVVQTGAHRFSYELHYGPIGSTDILVCHTCDNRLCVNPAHLWLGSHKDNAEDMVAKQRSHRGVRSNSKLTESLVRIIRLRAGTHQAIADEFGVSRRLVGMVKSRQVWGWVD